MNKKDYIAIAGLCDAALALFNLHKATRTPSRQPPLKRTIKHIIEQSLDNETYSLVRAFEEHLRALPPDDALKEAQLYIDGKLPIGSLGPGIICYNRTVA